MSRRVVKVVGRGLTTSFRYPHWTMGDQPTFLMPPPATIYGHICSAVGQMINPDNLRFALYFRYASRGIDLEHLHYAGGPQTVPVRREVLYLPELVLYVEPSELVTVFRRPAFPVVLGRSQDLFSYQSITLVDLELADQAYFEHTLLPIKYAACFDVTETVALPRWISEDRRIVDYGHYAVLENRGVWPDPNAYFRYEEEIPVPMWVDPESEPDADGRRRGLIFHAFTG